MTYQVTARKWRPMRFDDVVAQNHVTTTLRNAISSNRLAHAYIFSGPRGIGKTTVARILAKVINCENPQDLNPDNACEICREITEGRSLDVIEIDGASNRGVEEIRNLRESVRYAPARGKYKVYVIDEVHMLTKEAFNALLKTLEEPPRHVLFIFATTEVHKVPATILSRCQRFDFRRIPIQETTTNLRKVADEEHVQISNDALLLIAKKADGSLRDAQGIFDQVFSFCGDNISYQQVLQVLNAVDQEMFFRVTDLTKEKNSKGGLQLVEEILSRGYDIREFLTGLAEHLRNLLIIRTASDAKLVEASESHRRRYEEEAKHFTESDILRFIRLVMETESAIRWSPQPRFKLEMCLVQMIQLDSTVQIDQLLQKLEELKKKLDGSVVDVLGRVKASAPAKAIPVEVMRKSVSPESSHHRRQPAATIEAGTGQPSSESLGSSTGETPTSSALSIEEFQMRWKAFVEEVKRQKIGIGSVLTQVRVLGIHDGAIQLGCPDEFHLGSLKRHREFLTTVAQRVYRTNRLLFEPLIRGENSPNGDQDAHRGGIETPVAGHPVIRALMRELGAEPLDVARTRRT
ncbi:MAG: DNA polymerase III subunit gamma/tau [Bacteroidota bacterium]